MKLSTRQYCCAAVAGLALLAAAQAQATNTRLSVAGTITPSACNISFPDGDRLDIGNVSVADLNAEGPTRLADKFASLRIECAGPTHLAMTVENGHPYLGYVGDLTDALNVHQTQLFTISTNDTLLGGYWVRMDESALFGDGELAQTWYRSGNGSWRYLSWLDTITADPLLRRSYSWGPVAAPYPGSAFTRIESRLRMASAVVSRRRLPPLGDELHLESRVIFKLAYL